MCYEEPQSMLRSVYLLFFLFLSLVLSALCVVQCMYITNRHKLSETAYCSTVNIYTRHTNEWNVLRVVSIASPRIIIIFYKVDFGLLCVWARMNCVIINIHARWQTNYVLYILLYFESRICTSCDLYVYNVRSVQCMGMYMKT